MKRFGDTIELTAADVQRRPTTVARALRVGMFAYVPPGNEDALRAEAAERRADILGYQPPLAKPSKVKSNVEPLRDALRAHGRDLHDCGAFYFEVVQTLWSTP